MVSPHTLCCRGPADCRQWQRDINAELDALGCDAEKRKRLVLGGSAAAWSGDASTFDYTTWEGTASVAERLWAGSHGIDVPLDEV